MLILYEKPGWNGCNGSSGDGGKLLSELYHEPCPQVGFFVPVPRKALLFYRKAQKPLLIDPVLYPLRLVEKGPYWNSRGPPLLHNIEEGMKNPNQASEK